MSTLICQHCRARDASRPRGLCQPCYNDPAIRRQYGVLPRANAGLGVGGGPRPAPPRTDAVTKEERLAVLEERAAAGQQLWCNEDARRDLT